MSCPSNFVMMSPPTSPALSAGPPGASTEPNVTPLSVVFQPSTPTYDLLTDTLITGEPAGLRIGCRSAVNAAAPTIQTRRPTNSPVIPGILLRGGGTASA